MNFFNYKLYEDKTVLKVTRNGEIIRAIDFKPGNQYVVNPLNKQKKKHRGRYVTLKGIESDKHNGILSAKVKYLDTNRSGKIILDDLDNILQ
ncbi:hypothetical protein [Terribacillus sp. JSM ZJ617]|uniref:hypothetical protein n=1 Tax=Terribacillus sp. JSM ZJ617 TaxID=3342119 RepID=UPI0035A91C87